MTMGHNAPPVSRTGWVAIARSMREHPIVGFHLHARPADPRKGAYQPALAFIDLIMECKYEDGSVYNGGRRMEIKRGQMIGAVSWLAHRWNWTPMAVRIWLDKLEQDMMISRCVPGTSETNKHNGRVSTIITLCNYSRYQSSATNDHQAWQQTNSNQATNEQQTNNNIYNDNNETKEQGNKRDTPLSPPTGGSCGPGNDPVVPPSDQRRPRKPKKDFTESELALTDEAVAMWNEIADECGFTRVCVVTPDRRNRTLKRLAAIGGIEQFKIALGAIKLVPFLMGREQPRAGEREPFRLDYERLLQTDGKLGDVLAKLIDKAADNSRGKRTSAPDAIDLILKAGRPNYGGIQ